MNSFDNIPQEMKELPQWVARVDKVPINPNSLYGAKSTDKTSWGTFEQAKAAIGKKAKMKAVQGKECNGIGFVLSAPYCGIDIDHCFNPETGEWSKEALDIIKNMNSYTEVSPSGTGVHIFYKNDGNTHTEWNKKKPIDGIQHLEMYQTDRYFTVTGEMFGGYTSLNERPAAADCIYKGYMQENEQPESKPFKATMPTQSFTPLTDNEIIEKATRSKNGVEFSSLWRGDTSKYNGDESRADLALCNILAFWSGCDSSTIDRLFRQSGLMREKWDRKTGGITYGEITIQKAINDCTETYNPNRKAETAMQDFSEGIKYAPKWVYQGEDGKRKYKTVNGYSVKEVEEKAQLIKLQIGKGMDVLNAGMKWGKLVSLWLAYKKSILSEGQYKTYSIYLSHFSALNDRPINKLVKSDFQQIILDEYACNSHTGKPTAKKTLRDWRGAVRQVFNYAIENRVIEFSPAQYIEIPRDAKTSERRALTAQEQLWVVSTEHRAQLPAMIMMFAGLRLGECLGLQWRDINLTERTIDVHQKLVTKGKAHIEQGAKTISGVRTVTDVPKILIDFLKKQPEHKPDDFVVTSTKGTLMSDTAWRRLWNSYMADLNIKYGDFSDYERHPKSKYDPKGVPFVIDRFTAHSLRHTCATNLLYTGHGLHYVQKQLGHAKPSTTLDIYTHYVESLPKRKSNKIISIDALIKEFKPTQKQA